MTFVSFLKGSLSFVVGAGLAGGLTWLGFCLWTLKHPLPGQQLGDVAIIFMYLAAAIATTLLMGIVGGIAGVVLVKRWFG